MEQDVHPITVLLNRYAKGDESVLNALIPQIYEELKNIAKHHMKRETSQTLQPTILVHEVYLKLLEQKKVQWNNRTHFFAIASKLMRRFLLDFARAKYAKKRNVQKVGLDENIVSFENEEDMEALNKALERLEEKDPTSAKVVELRYFGGLSLEEISSLLNTSLSTVKREWAFAKAWLHKEISDGTRLD